MEQQESMEQQQSSSGNPMGIIVIAGIILFIAMGALGPHSWFMGKWDAAQHQSLSPASGSSIVGGPSLSAQKIDSILSGAGSPALGTGQDLYNLSAEYNIDDAFALAVFKRESTFGKYGVANSSLSLGNLRCIDGYSCQGGYAYFPSWQAGYKAFYALISGPLYVGAGLTTPSAIMPRYAPSQDSNDPVAYANNVEQSIAEWRAA